MIVNYFQSTDLEQSREEQNRRQLSAIASDEVSNTSNIGMLQILPDVTNIEMIKITIILAVGWQIFNVTCQVQFLLSRSQWRDNTNTN